MRLFMSIKFWLPLYTKEQDFLIEPVFEMKKIRFTLLDGSRASRITQATVVVSSFR
jgi:hypothetical protein